jgi:hypothetical protein
MWASKKKLQSRGELVDVQPPGESELDVAEPVGQRVRQLLRRPSIRPRGCDSPETLSGLYAGIVALQCSIRSPINRRCGSGANSHSFCAMYSLKMSVCKVPFSRAGSTPCRSAATT